MFGRLFRRSGSLAHYARSAPSAQQIADLFAGQWVSRFPADAPAVSTGAALLFEDARLAWAMSRLDVTGKRVLELGPLEGGHSYMLERGGAVSVTAVEANRKAYLRCLAVKEIFALARVRFLLGDFLQYLRESSERFDLCVASGVLYHMENPAELIELVAQHSNALYCWTHYFDRDRIKSNPRIRHRAVTPVATSHRDFAYEAHRIRYGIGRHRHVFCGSAEAVVTWMPRDDIERCCRHFGFETVETAFDDPTHPSGPCFAFVARRSRTDRR